MRTFLKYYISFLFSLTSNYSFTQQNKFDSLDKIVQTTKNDTLKVLTLFKMDDLIYVSDPKLDLELNHKIRGICLNNLRNVKRKHIIRFYKINLAKSLNNIGDYFRQSSMYDSSMKYHKRALSLRKEINDLNGIADSYCNIGTLFAAMGNNYVAIDYLVKALKYYQLSKNEIRIMAVNVNLGLAMFSIGNYPEALKRQYSAIKYASKIGNDYAIASAYVNIGNIYCRINNYEDAIKSYSKSLAISKKIDNKAGISQVYTNLGVAYKSLNQLDLALKFHNLGLETSLDRNDLHGAATSYNGIGSTYSKMKNYEEARRNYLLALELSKNIGDKHGITVATLNISGAYLFKSDFQNAKLYASRALSDINGEKEALKMAFQILSRVDSAQNNYHGALQNYKLYITYRDSLSNEENTKKIVQSQMQYEFDKQQSADSIKNAEHAKQETIKHNQEIKQQRIYTYGGIIGFSLMMIVAIVSFRAFRQKQKANSIIAEQKQLVEEKQKEVLDSIHYAKRIQLALLPSKKYIQKTVERLKSK